MNLKHFQVEALKTAIYPNRGNNIEYAALGLAGEAGEVCNKVKKKMRDGKLDEEGLFNELGDVLWYWAACCDELGCNPEDVAETVIVKLRGRAERGVIGGSGDKR